MPKSFKEFFRLSLVCLLACAPLLGPGPDDVPTKADPKINCRATISGVPAAQAAVPEIGTKADPQKALREKGGPLNIFNDPAFKKVDTAVVEKQIAETKKRAEEAARERANVCMAAIRAQIPEGDSLEYREDLTGGQAFIILWKTAGGETYVIKAPKRDSGFLADSLQKESDALASLDRWKQDGEAGTPNVSPLYVGAHNIVSHKKSIQVKLDGRVYSLPCTQFVEGGTLLEHLTQFRDLARTDPKDFLLKLRGLVQGVAAFHNRPDEYGGPIIHRDIKPENIFVGKNGLLLGDSGLVEKKGEVPLLFKIATTRRGVQLQLPTGTPSHMLVEELEGKERVVATEKADMHGLRTSYSEMLMGIPILDPRLLQMQVAVNGQMTSIVVEKEVPLLGPGEYVNVLNHLPQDVVNHVDTRLQNLYNNQGYWKDTGTLLKEIDRLLQQEFPVRN